MFLDVLEQSPIPTTYISKLTSGWRKMHQKCRQYIIDVIPMKILTTFSKSIAKIIILYTIIFGEYYVTFYHFYFYHYVADGEICEIEKEAHQDIPLCR